MQVLFVGAHPDDIELGAGALAQRLTTEHEVHFLVLTDEDRAAERRRIEARTAAQDLGIRESRVHFAGLADGSLKANARSVRFLRELLGGLKLNPDVVVVHSSADSHNDHVAANRLLHAVVREKVILHFAVHISSESEFAPKLFLEVTPERRAGKSRAITRHSSQRDRLTKRDLLAFDADAGSLAGLPSAESFEVVVQAGASAATLAEVRSFSDSAFHRFWDPIIGDGTLTLLYASPNRPGALIDWPTVDESIGRDALREAFRVGWLPGTPLVERASSEVDATEVLLAGTHILLAGGPVSNEVVRDVYNRLSSVRWAIDFELPRSTSAFVRDRRTGVAVQPPDSPDGSLIVLSNIENPYHPGRRLMLAAGTSGPGTRRALELIADPGSFLRDIVDPGRIPRFEMVLALESAGLRLIEADFD